MSTLTQQQIALPRWHVPKVVAMLLAFTAAVLTVVSSFLPLLSASLSAGSVDEEVTVTAWHMTSTAGDAGDVPANGYPLVFAALFLFVAAVIAWFAASPSTTPGTHRMAGLLTAVGAAFLLGAVWTVSGQTVNTVDVVISMGNLMSGMETEATYDVGFWLLLVSGLLALTAAVLALIPGRQPTWPAPAPQSQLVDVPVVHQLPPEPPPLPQFQVDPLTGQPLTQNPYGQRFPGSGFQPAANLTGPPTNPFAAIPQQQSAPAAVPQQQPAPAAVPQQQPPASAVTPEPAPAPAVPASTVPASTVPAQPRAPEQPPGPAVPAVEDPLSEPRQP